MTRSTLGLVPSGNAFLGGTILAQPQGVLRDLLISRAELGASLARRGEGGVGRGRVVPGCPVHPDRHDRLVKDRCALLQPAGHGGAVHQGGQVCREVDAGLVSRLQGHSGSIAASHAAGSPRRRWAIC